MKKHVVFYICIYMLLYCTTTRAQSERGRIIFDIETIVANEKEKKIDLFLSAYNRQLNGDLKGLVVANPDRFIITETIAGETKEMPIQEVTYISENVGYTKNLIYLMIEVSETMNQKGYATAKSIIKELFLSNSLVGNKNQQVRIAWFNEQIIGNESFDLKGGYKDFVEKEQIISGGSFSLKANLNQSLLTAITELSETGNSSKKIILLFTDGRSLSEQVEEQAALMSSIGGLGNDFQLYIIGMGNITNKVALDSICKMTPSPKDFYDEEKFPDQVITNLLRGVGEPIENLKISVNTHKERLGNETRKYSVEYRGERQSKVIKEAVFSPSSSIADIRPEQLIELSFQKTLMIGAGIILGFLGIFSIAIPLFNQFYFKQNHVKKYGNIKKSGITASDPLTMQPIEDDEMVVVMGNKIMSLDTWKYLRKNGQGETAKDYGDFFEKQLTGSFFSQRGLFQRLNWLWFGLLGGFIAWGTDVLLGQVEIGFYSDFLKSLLDTSAKQISPAIYAGTMTGISLGFGICSTLALVDELGQSRKFSIIRVLKRIVVGTLIAIPVFFLESYLTTAVLNYNYLGGLVGWTIFGTAIGLVVTLFSIIEKKNGLIGGFIAGVISFHLYYLLQYVPQISGLLNADFARMISFILYGGLLGYILFTVVSRLEDFELVYVSPQAFNGQVKAISKWLKSPGIEAIYIGTDPKSEVYIKWADQDPQVKERHAKLTYEKGEVFIEAIEDAEILVNNLVMREKKSLEDGDKILLGSHSISMIQFREKGAKKRKEKEAPNAVEDKKVAVRITLNN